MKLECIIVDDEPHVVEELSDMIDLVQGITVLKKFHDAKSAIVFLKERGHIDVVFSDINMHSMNGIEAGILLKSYCDFLVYITAHKEFALDAFGVNADGYLIKPLNSKILKEKIEFLLKIKKDIFICYFWVLPSYRLHVKMRNLRLLNS